MGGWYLSRLGGDGAGARMFADQHSGVVVRRHEISGYSLLAAGSLADPEPLISVEVDGTLIAVAGTMSYKGHWGSEAAGRLLEDYAGARVDESRLAGAFAVVVSSVRGLSVFSDWLGNVCIYRTGDGHVWSTSFLATASSCDALTLDVQGAYEYVLQESTLGETTVCREVSRAAPQRIHRLSGSRSDVRPDPLIGVELAGGSLDDHADRNLAVLRPQFRTLEGLPGIDTALSGGYDSRLILSLLLETGAAPRLHVYGTSDDSDVKVAEQIAGGEGLSLKAIDKAQLAVSGSRSREEQTRENYLAFDGVPIDGIFDSGADLATRRERMKDGFVLLNGGGGEVFRNFYYLREASFSPRQLLRAFYGRFSPTACGSLFDTEAHFSNMEKKLRAELEVPKGNLTRLDVERSYPLFRCRFWMARNTSINVRIGSFLTPLVEPAAVREALATPLSIKNLGRLQSRMIERINPRLAAYDSSYGFPFNRTPPLGRRITGRASLLRPVFLRERSFRIRQHLKRHAGGAQDPEAAGLEFSEEVRHLFNVEDVLDAGQRARIATLSYLMRDLSVQLNS